MSHPDPVSLVEWSVGLFLGGVSVYSYFADKREKKTHKIREDARYSIMRAEGQETEKILSVIESDVVGGIDSIRHIVDQLAARATLDEEIAKRSILEASSYHAMNEALFKAATIPIIIYNRDGYIISWNDAATIMFEWRDTEAVGRNITLIIPERLRAAHYEEFERFRIAHENKTIGSSVRTYALHRNGSEIDVTISTATWHDMTGNDYFCSYIMPERKTNAF